MIKVIDYQKVDMTEQEFGFYQEIVKQYTENGKNGADYFRGLFLTDKDGIITIIKPVKQIPWAVLFFIQNLMINQKLRSNDKRLDSIEKQLRKKEK